MAEQEHERDGMGEKDGPSENSHPNAHGDAGEKGLGHGVEGKELMGHQGLTGGEAGGTNPDNRGVKRKMVERCEAGVNRGGRKERDKGQIKGNHILKKSIGTGCSISLPPSLPPSISLPLSRSLPPDRALCLPTFSNFLIVNKTFSLSRSLSLSLLGVLELEELGVTERGGLGGNWE